MIGWSPHNIIITSQNMRGAIPSFPLRHHGVVLS